jgi:3',5'-cyclic AMP phosphodiesterase CpdA
MRKAIVFFGFLLALLSTLLLGQSPQVQFIFTTDSHYGLTRPAFRGATNVDSHIVNGAMVAKMNKLPEATFPSDGGIRAGQSVGAVDFVADGGDITNREEATGENGEAFFQSSAKSWAQFRSDYIDGLTLLDSMHRKAAVYVVPGNHDASNAVGYYKPMSPRTDKTSMAEIFNWMTKPASPRTADTYDYDRDKMMASHGIAGIHFVFLTLWPDTRTRTWLEDDLEHAGVRTPVIIFAHDPPDSDWKQFKNPVGKHDINPTDTFENLLSDTLAEPYESGKPAGLPIAEQTAWEDFIRNHPNVTAYFHGHSNWNQFYDWTGPNHTVALHAFRADSPMKGHFSATDETKLSFQIATIDPASRTMTVREVLWNADTRHPDAPVSWGASTTFALSPRPRK